MNKPIRHVNSITCDPGPRSAAKIRHSLTTLSDEFSSPNLQEAMTHSIASSSEMTTKTSVFDCRCGTSKPSKANRKSLDQYSASP